MTIKKYIGEFIEMSLKNTTRSETGNFFFHSSANWHTNASSAGRIIEEQIDAVGPPTPKGNHLKIHGYFNIIIDETRKMY